MTKLQLLLRPATHDLTPPADFAARVRGAAPSLLGRSSARLKLTLTTAPPPRLSLIPFRRPPLALLSVWTDGDPRQVAAEHAAPLREVLPGARLAAYRVSEALPCEYRRDWPDGVETPGPVLITTFRKPPRLPWDEFLRAWHGHHTPLSLQVHPLWCYVRNVVEEALVDGSPPLDAIVEELFRSPADLHNPLRFFGGPLSAPGPRVLAGPGRVLRALPNMIRVGLDIRRFIDLGSMENHLARELWLRS